MKAIWSGSAALLAMTLFSTPDAGANVVINEIWNGSTIDEWVEFHNNGASAVDVSGWKFVRRTDTGTVDTVLYTFPTGTSIAAGGYYAIGDSGTGNSLDGTYTNAISTGNQGIALRNASDVVVDSLATGSGAGAGSSAYLEGTHAPAASTGTSVKRKPIGTDTNNGGTDFVRDTTRTFKLSNDTVIAPTTVADLAAARAAANGTEIIISGAVTVTAATGYNTTGRNQFVVQDASGDGASGILVDDQAFVAAQNVTVGQTISGLRGNLSLFNGLLQLVPTQAITVSGTATIPAPQVLTGSVTDINAIESELITINGVTIAETGTWAASTNYSLVTPTGLVVSVIRIGSGSPLIGQAIPTGTLSVTGVAGDFNGTGQIQPRTAADISVQSSVSDWTLY